MGVPSPSAQNRAIVGPAEGAHRRPRYSTCRRNDRRIPRPRPARVRSGARGGDGDGAVSAERTIPMNSSAKLTDTPLTALSAASRREDRRLIMPDKFRGGAASKLLAALTRKGMIELIGQSEEVGGARGANLAGLTNYRISALGLASIGVAEVEPIPTAAEELFGRRPPASGRCASASVEPSHSRLSAGRFAPPEAARTVDAKNQLSDPRRPADARPQRSASGMAATRRHSRTA